MYATVGARKCIPFLPDHIVRIDQMYVEASGDLWINGALHPVLSKVCTPYVAYAVTHVL